MNANERDLSISKPFIIRLKIISIGLIAAPIFYTLVCILLGIFTQEFKEHGFADFSSNPHFMYYQIAAWSIGFGLSFSAVSSKRKLFEKWINQFSLENQNFEFLQMRLMFLHFQCDVLAVFSLILILLSGNSSANYLALGVSFVCHLLLFPTNKDFEI